MKTIQQLSYKAISVIGIMLMLTSAAIAQVEQTPAQGNESTPVDTTATKPQKDNPPIDTKASTSSDIFEIGRRRIRGDHNKATLRFHTRGINWNFVAESTGMNFGYDGNKIFTMQHNGAISYKDFFTFGTLYPDGGIKFRKNGDLTFEHKDSKLNFKEGERTWSINAKAPYNFYIKHNEKQNFGLEIEPDYKVLISNDLKIAGKAGIEFYSGRNYRLNTWLKPEDDGGNKMLTVGSNFKIRDKLVFGDWGNGVNLYEGNAYEYNEEDLPLITDAPFLSNKSITAAGQILANGGLITYDGIESFNITNISSYSEPPTFTVSKAGVVDAKEYLIDGQPINWDGTTFVNTSPWETANEGIHTLKLVTIGSDKAPIAGTKLHVDGRVYISENEGEEAGFDDVSSENYEDYLLWVEEGIVAWDIAIVDTEEWPDYVFDASYELKGLDELESFIKEKGHLHTMPSAQEVEKTGFTLSDMTKRTLKTVEELTLHTIAQEKKIKAQNSQIEELKTLTQNLLERLKRLEK